MAVTVVNSVNPIVVSGTTNTNDEVLSHGAGIFIKFVYWYLPTTTGHKASLQTKDGRVITKLYCEADNRSLYGLVWTKFENIYCNDLDSGTLYIYIK